ncbi:MAG: DUF5063 domain-containing protein [Bacteroidales bacterium]|nr:DUF5063 domain-containing protein [Bacteroidales bacterium]
MEQVPLIYRPEAIAFVADATQYCIAMEQTEQPTRGALVTTLRQLLPVLYLKVNQLPYVEVEDFFEELPEVVTEADYDYVRRRIAVIMGEQDDYLDVLVEDMKYSDRPIRKSVSEDLADLYQPLRNFVESYKQGNEDTMLLALAQIQEDYAQNWGQVLLSVLRALHDVYYTQGVPFEEEAETD